jgi:hypothetical protein
MMVTICGTYSRMVIRCSKGSKDCIYLKFRMLFREFMYLKKE